MPPFFDEAFIRKLERLALLSRQAVVSDSQGERRSSQRGQSVEFADFRPYVSGDDFRRIDWNAYARLERFFIKLFLEEQDLTLHLMIDASRSMDWGNPHKLDYALKISAAVGYIALLGLDRVTATIVGGASDWQRLPPLRGKRRAIELFNFLANIQANSTIREDFTKKPLPTGGLNIDRRLAAYASDHLPGPILLLTDLMDDGWQAGINALAARGYEVTLLHILSPDEINPAFSGDFKLRDSENSTIVELTADFETIDRYRQRLMAWQDDWRRFTNARQAHYIPISTELPLEELIFGPLRIQGILR
jgi:uncharacterized protein (DUF58 family)